MTPSFVASSTLVTFGSPQPPGTFHAVWTLRLILNIQMAIMKEYVKQMHTMNEDMIEEHRRYFSANYGPLINKMLNRSTG